MARVTMTAISGSSGPFGVRDNNVELFNGACYLYTAFFTMSSTITETNIVDATAGSSSSAGQILGEIPGFSRTSTDGQDDLELMSMPSVVGRESGERDPLLLRGSIMSDETIKGLRQSVIKHCDQYVLY
jgi:hypothetical protein